MRVGKTKWKDVLAICIVIVLLITILVFGAFVVMPYVGQMRSVLAAREVGRSEYLASRSHLSIDPGDLGFAFLGIRRADNYDEIEAAILNADFEQIMRLGPVASAAPGKELASNWKKEYGVPEAAAAGVSPPVIEYFTVFVDAKTLAPIRIRRTVHTVLMDLADDETVEMVFEVP